MLHHHQFVNEKKTLEKPAQITPPLPTFNELLRQVQLRPIDKSTKPICLKEKSSDDDYENSLLSIPVPRSSPIPTTNEIPTTYEVKAKEIKHEYAMPIKKKPKENLCHKYLIFNQFVTLNSINQCLTYCLKNVHHVLFQC